MGERKLAVVRELDGPTRAEEARDRLRGAIQRGEVLPGQPVSLRAVAERHGCRLSTLLVLVGELERDGLLSLHGDVAMVAELDARELHGALRIVELLRNDLAQRGCGRVWARPSGARARFPRTVTDFDTEVFWVGFGRVLTFWQPVATAVDRRALRLAADVLRRYCNLAAASVSGIMAGPELVDYYDQQRDLLARYRSGNLRIIQEGNSIVHRQMVQFTEVSLDRCRAATDHPVAEVISLRTPQRDTGLGTAEVGAQAGRSGGK